jgi:hypothetical protein
MSIRTAKDWRNWSQRGRNVWGLLSIAVAAGLWWASSVLEDSSGPKALVEVLAYAVVVISLAVYLISLNASRANNKR